MTTYLRKLKPQTHASVPRAPLEDAQELSWRAVGILVYMLTRPDDWELRKGDLVNRHREGRDAVLTATNELRAAGYVRQVPRPGGGTDWVVSETAMTDEEWAVTLADSDARVSRESDDPTHGFSVHQKPVPLSTPEHKLPSGNSAPARKTRQKKTRRRTQVPDGFRPTKEHLAYAMEHSLDVEDERERFLLYHQKEGTLAASWNASFSLWLRNAVKFRERDAPATAERTFWG